MLPNNEKEALFTVDDQIQMLERRLSNAKAARDAFVNHLRGKYPNWTPPLPVMSYQEADFPSIGPSLPHASSSFPSQEPLLSRLATAQFQWDVDQDQGRKERMWIRSRPNYKALYAGNEPRDIPTSGPLLESDIRRSRIRLREISEELRSMRIDRMSLTTEQWFQEQGFREQKSIPLHFGSSYHRDHPQVDPLDQVMLDLSRIHLTETSPIETPRTERKIEIEMEESQEKLREEILAQESTKGAEPKGAEPNPTVVRFQEPILAKPVEVPPPLVEAPPPQAPPTQVPPTQAPPPLVEAPQAPPTSTISSLLANMGIGKTISDDEEDSPRFKGPPTQNPFDYSSLNLGGGLGADDSSSDDAMPIPKRGVARVNKSDDDDDDFWG